MGLCERNDACIPLGELSIMSVRHDNTHMVDNGVSKQSYRRCFECRLSASEGSAVLLTREKIRERRGARLSTDIVQVRARLGQYTCDRERRRSITVSMGRSFMGFRKGRFPHDGSELSCVLCNDTTSTPPRKRRSGTC